jgi:alpha-tubulin suppressor-like RCC1 family protein
VELTRLMGRATVGVAGMAMTVLLLPPLGPAGSPVLLTGAAGAATPPASAIRTAVAASSATKVTAVAGGLYHSLALSSNGAVFAWGWNIAGQLCNGSTNGSDLPMKVTPLDGIKVTGIAAGFAHSLAVTSTGAVYNCGKNDDGELGDGGTTDSDVPVKVDLPAGAKVTAVVAGAGHSLAVTSTGAVLAWGLDLFGALGNGSTGGSSAVPVDVNLPAGTKVTAVAAGALHSLALTSTGAVFAWGFNANGELGDGGTANTDVPVKVKLPAGTKVTAIAAGGYYSLALTSTGAVFAWGFNADGELGDGGTANTDVPVKVKLPAGTKVTAMASGGSLYGVGQYGPGPGHSLAVTSSGAVFAWGHNANGELGDGGTANSDVPVKVKLPGGTKITTVAAGELQSLAVTSAGTVLAWGGNDFGQLGDGGTANSDVPVRVNLLGPAVRQTATLVPAQSMLAVTAPVTTTQSTVFAGYNFPNYIAVPGAVSANIVVPQLNCKATPSAGSSIYVGVGIQSVNTYARLYLGCTPQHVARYYPSLLVNGGVRNIPSDAAHPGDTIEFAVSQSVSKVTGSVIDMTHKFIATSNGAGSGTSEGIMAGDFPAASGSPSGVPNFGTLVFSSALINGYPFGSAEPGLQADDLSATSTDPVQIKTSISASNKEAFATAFDHA